MTNRSKFTPEEDQKLIYIVSSSPDIKWSKVAELMKNKTSRQCRERYKNYLANGINQSPWSPEEDQVLLKAYSEIGPSWSHMTSLFKGRTCVNIKNHYAKIKNKVDKPEKTELQPKAKISNVDIERKANTSKIQNLISNSNQNNIINNGCNIIPFMVTPTIAQAPMNQPIHPVCNSALINKDQDNACYSIDTQQINMNSGIPGHLNYQNSIYDFKYLTKKQQVFQQLQLQHQQQFNHAESNELQSQNEKKGPLYVLPFFGDTSKIESSPDSFVNLISLKVKNDPKKLLEQDIENSQAINFYENDQDVLLYQHQLTSLSDVPSLMISAERPTSRIESPMYEPDSFVDHDDLSAIYDFSHDYGDFNACQDALFIPLG